MRWNMELINRALSFAEEFFSADFSGHDYYHTERVYKLARRIAEREHCDKELVLLAAILHDVDDRKLVEADHEPYVNAKRFLKGEGVSSERIEAICHIISQVSFKGSDSVAPDTIEGMIVQDADRLDAIGAIGIARTFAYGGSHHSPMYDPKDAPQYGMDEKAYFAHRSSSVNHFYEKLLLLKDMINTEAGKRIAEERHRYMEDFLKQFFAEWNGEA